jgi:hypothetical protein
MASTGVYEMKCPEDVARELETVRAELEKSGNAALAERVDRSIADLRERVTVPMPKRAWSRRVRRRNYWGSAR